jgi:hypothetical protein
MMLSHLHGHGMTELFFSIGLVCGVMLLALFAFLTLMSHLQSQ